MNDNLHADDLCECCLEEAAHAWYRVDGKELRLCATCALGLSAEAVVRDVTVEDEPLDRDWGDC